ncbi:MAG: hypothetical protein KHY61_09730, partial [Sutterella wadsworthensis]|uniref:hypothetical protein n=1 Tax=Sutterella seckii TaxID=1944635 RepID=UPI001D03EB96
GGEARAGLQEWPCGRRGLWWFYLHNSFINYNITIAACQLFCAYVNKATQQDQLLSQASSWKDA